jgi:hypothetical protein
MKKIIVLSCLVLVTLGLSSSYILKSVNGQANATGSPGETTCSGGGCHGGGSSSTTGVSVTAVPAFVNDEYYPDSMYTISVSVQAVGFTKFGFGCEILDGNNLSAGTMTLAGTGVKFLGSSFKRNAVHTSPKTAANSIAVFSFKWIAPTAGTGPSTFYICGNAVNGNNNTSGDLPIPFSYGINEGVAPIDSSSLNPEAIVKLSKNLVNGLKVSPNPANGAVQVLYDLSASASLNMSLYHVNGTLVKTLVKERQFGGENKFLFNTNEFEPGAYFLKVQCNGQEQASKLLIIQ